MKRSHLGGDESPPLWNCMLIGEDAYAMLLTESKFGEFAKKGIADPFNGTEAIYAVTADSRVEVDDLTEKALASGGSPANDPYDLGFMYGKSFNDPDGHLWILLPRRRAPKPSPKHRQRP